MRDIDKSEKQLNMSQGISAQEHRVRAQAHKDALKAQWRTFLKTGVFVLIIVAIFVLVFAWFVNTQTNEGNGMRVQADKTDITLTEVIAFNYTKELVNEEGKSEIRYTFQKTMDISNLTMAHFDGINENNDKTPIIIRCKLRGSEIEQRNAFTLIFDIIAHDDWETKNYLSNITNVRAAYIPNSVIPEEMIDDDNLKEELWTLAKGYLKDSAASRFVKLTDGEPTSKVSALEYSFAESSYQLTSDGSVYIYFMIDYDNELLIKYVKGNRLSSEIGMGGIRIDFKTEQPNKDFNAIKIKTVNTAD